VTKYKLYKRLWCAKQKVITEVQKSKFVGVQRVILIDDTFGNGGESELCFLQTYSQIMQFYVHVLYTVFE